MSSTQKVSQAIEKYEYDLIKGRARWIADLVEFFRNFRVGDITFDLYARGRTRGGGFLLSRFFAWTVLPDYSVSLLCVDESRKGTLTIEKLRRRMEAALQLIHEQDCHWGWLVAFSDKDFPASTVSFVSRYDRDELGLGVVSMSSGELVTSNNQLGRSIVKQMGLGSFLKRFLNGKND